MAASATLLAAASEPPRFGLAHWEAMPGPMPLPVFDAAAAAIGKQLVVMGGVTEELEATPAIQIRHPIHGWLPVGSNLLEPRARPTLTPLIDGRWLVLGGWSGTWRRDAVQLDDGETVDPLVAGSSRRVDPFGEGDSLEGHSATPLPDGRVVVVCGCRLRIFDPYVDGWTLDVELNVPHRKHAVALAGWMLLIVGGDELGSIESVLLSEPAPHAELWSQRLPEPVVDASAIALDDRFAYVVGGARTTDGRTIDTTCVLDAARREVRDSAPLGLARGAAQVTLALHPRGVLALGGEWRIDVERGSSEVAMLLRPLAPAGERQWRLPVNSLVTRFARRVVVRRSDGSLEMLGGYRFVPPDRATEGEEPGVYIDGTAQRLVVDSQGVSD